LRLDFKLIVDIWQFGGWLWLPLGFIWEFGGMEKIEKFFTILEKLF